MTTVKDRVSGVSISSHDDGSVTVRDADNVELAFTQDQFAEFVRTAQEVLDDS